MNEDDFLDGLDPLETPLSRWLRRQPPYKRSDALDDTEDDFLPDRDKVLDFYEAIVPHRRDRKHYSADDCIFSLPSIRTCEGETLPEHCPRCRTEFVFDIQDTDPPSVLTTCKCGRWRFQFEGEPND